ncbi:MAG TPA: peptidoglycan-binding domain-containing protein, partial [Candidatus Acidoferrales bacterium]|nr:peptidoglycan-binding domain-containing protein [Candidatus Acidoferrales bacterium]
MTSKLSRALLFLLVSGCVMEDPEPQIQESHLSPVTVSEKQVDMIKRVEPVEAVQTPGDQTKLMAGNVSNPKNMTPSKDDIKLFQVRLKTVGFDPGPVDGVLGPKTENALVKFQSTCAVLDHVLNMAEMENLWQDSDSEATKANATTHQAFDHKNEIR